MIPDLGRATPSPPRGRSSASQFASDAPDPSAAAGACPPWARRSRPTSGCGRPTAASTRCRTSWSASRPRRGPRCSCRRRSTRSIGRDRELGPGAVHPRGPPGDLLRGDQPGRASARPSPWRRASTWTCCRSSRRRRATRSRFPRPSPNGGPGPVQRHDAGSRWRTQRGRGGGRCPPRKTPRRHHPGRPCSSSPSWRWRWPRPTLLRRRRVAPDAATATAPARGDRQAATRLTISANTAGEVTGNRWPESSRMTSTGGGSRRTMISCISGRIGRSLLVQHVGDGDAGGGGPMDGLEVVVHRVRDRARSGSVTKARVASSSGSPP